MINNKTTQKIALIHPLIVFGLFVLSFFSSTVWISGQFVSFETGEVIALCFSLLLAFCMYGWMLITTKFILIHSPVPEFTKYHKLKIHYYILLIFFVVFAGVVSFDLIKTGTNLTFLEILPAFVMIFSGQYLLIYIIWSTAKSLVYAEDGKKVAASRVFGTAFQIFYFPICIFWLHKRLLKLKNENE